MPTPEFRSDFTDLIQLETSDCLASEPGQAPNTFYFLFGSTWISQQAGFSF